MSRLSFARSLCKHCGLEIEGEWPFPRGEWRDRGNNRHCPHPSGKRRTPQLHVPNTGPGSGIAGVAPAPTRS